jgi:competence protein ComGC
MKKAVTYYLPLTTYPHRRGFSLIELLLFAAIFSIVMVIFITILVTVTRVQTRQSSVAEVNSQSQFLLQKIQYYVQASSLIDMPKDTPTTTLKLRMAASSSDPTYIYASGTAIYLKQTDSGAPQALNSNKVNVSSLSFTKRSNSPSHDSVDVSFVVSYNTSNIQQQFAEVLRTAVARVNAATFDSNVVPSSTAIYNLGVTGQIWNSVNNIIYFSGSNVGIGASSPKKVLEVAGDVYIDTTSNGLIMRDTSGICWTYRPSTTGTLTTTSSTCP